ncbi:beta-microseminoprotein [Ambystoma mexicanum]|uniref:beta-microseminoprotein n=1 Tax=Ambystoma mexicanum TaxID=8296 RepID=UPI0037E84B87
MKNTVFFALAVAVLASLCDAQCYLDMVEPGAKGCMKDGTMHRFGETFLDDECYECTCSTSDMNCCNTAAIPVDYDEEACIRLLDKINCKYTVVKKDNHDEECEYRGMVL